MAPKKQSTSSSSRLPHHSHDRQHCHRGPDHHDHGHDKDNHHDDHDDYDGVEDSGRDTLKPLLSSRDSDRHHGHGHSSRDHRGGGGRSSSRHRRHDHREGSGGKERSSRRQGGDASNNGSGSGLGRLFGRDCSSSATKARSKENHRRRNNGGGRTMTSDAADKEEAEFRELLTDQMSVACSTITPPSVFRDVGIDDNDDATPSTRLCFSRGIINYKLFFIKFYIIYNRKHILYYIFISIYTI